jgi:hypothetical protein
LTFLLQQRSLERLLKVFLCGAANATPLCRE